MRGQHIYDPHDPGHALDEAVSLTFIGPDVLEADRFATAAFAMGRDGIDFLEGQPGAVGRKHIFNPLARCCRADLLQRAAFRGWSMDR